MKRKIRILYVAAEISPYANAGGLGEVGRSFPKALLETGKFEVQRVMPLYKRVNSELKYIVDFPVEMDLGYETCNLKFDPDSIEIPTYFIQNDKYFYRDNIYAYEDDGVRFFFFCKAIVEMLKKITFHPDIIHINDWHSGFLPLLIKKEFPNIKSVYTIHNVSYHGFIPASYLKGVLPEEELYPLGYPQWLNFMKAAIKYSDLVTTVSPGYAEEILQPELGSGMSELLQGRVNRPVGILNGIDIESYDPSREDALEFPYDISCPERKKLNRTWIRNHYGLPDEEIPLVAMITRLEYEKGMDILLKALRYVDLKAFQLVILGTGNSQYQDVLTCISKSYSGRVVVDFRYSFEQAKRIYAAADIYLMPSLYEPCGLGQLYAMRYGAVPIVNPVGGLKNTVKDLEKPELSNGFYMKEWSGEALSQAIHRAIKTYHSTNWINYIRNGMQYDSSWTRSMVEYQKNYEALLKDDE